MLGPTEERELMTGLHSVADIFCSNCNSRLGWKYLEAFEHRRALASLVFLRWPRKSACRRLSQKYKEGKFIVEKAKVAEGPPI